MLHCPRYFLSIKKVTSNSGFNASFLVFWGRRRSQTYLGKRVSGAKSSVWQGTDSHAFINCILFSICKINEGGDAQVKFFLKWKLITPDTGIGTISNQRAEFSPWPWRANWAKNKEVCKDNRNRPSRKTRTQRRKSRVFLLFQLRSLYPEWRR